MKTVFIARHSHAEEHALLGKDINRKLTKEGIKDAELMAARIAESFPSIELVYTSDATRAKQTATIYCEVLGCTLIEQSNLYNASHGQIKFNLSIITDMVNNILLVAHNPGITNYINSLQIVTLDNMPTAGIFGFESQCTRWTELHEAEKKYIYFSYPRI
jgi:phosphohistidine phosphatase